MSFIICQLNLFAVRVGKDLILITVMLKLPYKILNSTAQHVYT